MAIYKPLKDPNQERGVPFQVLLKPSDVNYAKLGGAKNMASALREGLAPYVKLGKERSGIIDAQNPPKKPRMEL
jgi:hypothetical protein